MADLAQERSANQATIKTSKIAASRRIATRVYVLHVMSQQGQDGETSQEEWDILKMLEHQEILKRRVC